MQISLKKLAHLSDLELFKIIISSADSFPGLYRVSPTWQQALQEDRYLKLINFLEIVFRSEAGERWKKSDWLSAHQHVFNLAYGKISRNENVKDAELKSIIKNKAQNWFQSPRSLDLALIDSQTPVSRILIDTCYYMMGSHLRFEKDQVLISFNQFDKSYFCSLKVSFEVASQYIDSIFSSASLNDLFLQSEVVARLEFDDQDTGVLSVDHHRMHELLISYPGNCPIFASVNYDHVLPVRWGKLIAMSNLA